METEEALALFAQKPWERLSFLALGRARHVPTMLVRKE